MSVATAAATGLAPMSRREVLEAMSGLLLGMFVALLSSTVVSAALPRIISDLGGTQTDYAWVVTATLLALTVSTPVWGKLADRVDRKRLVQSALVIYVVGSAAAGMSESTGFLIGCRVLQGMGAGGMMALVQVIFTDLVSPRERGRYMGFIGAIMAVGMISGPVLGGVITDGIGWRGTFYVGVPFAVAAIVVLQRTLHLPPRERGRSNPDYLGTALVTIGVSVLLVWISFAGSQFDWLSTQTAVMVPVALLSLAAAVAVERRVSDPLIPLELFRNRTIRLVVIATVAVGIAIFGTSIFLVQYMQIAHERTPTESGLLTMPMVLASMLASAGVGQIISRTGRYKRWMLLGSVLLTAGLGLMGTLTEDTNLVLVGAYQVVIGLGMGMLMQNLVLVAQNSLGFDQMGAGSALVAFFRSLAGASGVAILGAVLASEVTSSIAAGLAANGIDPSALGSGSGSLPDVRTLQEPIRGIVEHAYGSGIAEIFLFAAPVGLIAIAAIALLPENPLGTVSGIEAAARKAEEGGADDAPEREPGGAEDEAATAGAYGP